MEESGLEPKATTLESPGVALDRAVSAVAARLDSLFLLEPGGTARAEAFLATLRAKLTLVMEGADPRPVRDWLASSPYCAPLFGALIAEIVSWPVESETAPAVLTVLRSCLETRPTGEGVHSAHGVNESEDLEKRMRGPGAFELLVEVAHDFRSPLASILFLAEALRDGHSGPVTDAQRSQLGLMYSAAFGLASIASDVMDLARQERDLIGDEPEPFSPSEVFRSVERMVQPIVEEKGLELRLVVPDRWRGIGHPHALSRVLLNLTTNALKFTDEGAVHIGVKAASHGRMEYYVQDTGRGISPEQQRTLFQPFKARSAAAKDGHHFSGSGIGLSIARRLVRAMGSELRLDSSDEAGTRFSFVLGTPRSR
jgi:signal transduction histidine kinase